MRPLFRQTPAGGTAEFYLRQPANLLLVKRERDGGVLICATADNLSTEQQEAFVRYLCAEGFASGAAGKSGWLREWCSDRETPPVRWIVDPSWPEADPAFTRHLQRLCWYMAGTLVVWLSLMAVLVCC